VNIVTTTGAKYVVDQKGRKKAVLLDMKEYSRLLTRMEELEDALDLDTAARTSNEFRDYREIREELVKEGRL
jgi:PHD/YefM family antitoxin component YafN of YafNO toxin-antitoxin module